MKTEVVKLKGTVKQILPNANYTVLLDRINKTCLCYLSGKMTKRFVKPEVGDTIEAEFSPLDLTKGRIISKG